ncbi:cobalamin biosynthesis protein CbiX [Klebsiella pneumoniae]|uniref:cobalamin biosynthesis protein CbiX n=1 Tax=Klebsiella pneumoniae TaxID=573 RepID=UPI0024B35C35|nr:cobalamin biosynthesis protein CbiX [Klebsiella pneumoniae]
MTTVTTPSQLKKEVESQKELLLRACLEAFNQLPNQRLQGALALLQIVGGDKLIIPFC